MTYEKRPGPPDVDGIRVWCRACRRIRGLSRIYWWEALGFYCGECSSCGNTMHIAEVQPGRARLFGECRDEPSTRG